MNTLDIGEEIYPRRLFYERDELKGTLSKGTESIEGLQVILQYALNKPGEIVGKVLGTQETTERISALSDLPGPYMSFRAKSRFESPYAYKFKSNKVWCKLLTHRSEPQDASYYAADLAFEEIKTEELFDPSFPFLNNHIAKDMPRRYISLYLAGPNILWKTHSTIKSSCSGNTRVEADVCELTPSNQSLFFARVVPWFFSDPCDDPFNYNLQTNIDALFLEPKADEVPLDDAFVSLGQSLAEDLTTVASIGSRSWVVWYGYSLRDGDSVVTYRRTTRKPGSSVHSWNSVPVDRNRCSEFLITSLNELRRLRDDNFDLFMPVTHYLDGLGSKTVEQRFTYLFLALEKLKDMYATQKGLAEILDNESFGLLRNEIQELVRGKIEDSEKAEMIINKSRELNRPSTRHILKKLFEDYEIDCSDLYPNCQDTYSYIQMRNDLFHSSRPVDLDRLWRETKRLTYVVERLLLRLLGWNDLSLSPREEEKQWIWEN